VCEDSYLEYLALSNFSSIGEAKVVFAPRGITIIQGENNIGKTNVIRAMKILFGESSFSEKRIRTGSTSAYIQAEVQVGKSLVEISLGRSSSAQEAMILVGDQQKKVSGARAIKSEIKNILPSVTFVDPFDVPEFLISGRGDSIYKRLLILFGFEVVVPALRRARSRIKEAERDCDEFRKEIEKTEKHLEEIAGAFNDLVDMQEALEHLRKEAHRLEKNRAIVKSILTSMEKATEGRRLVRKLARLRESSENYERVRDKVRRLVNMLANTVKNMYGIKYMESKQSALRRAREVESIRTALSKMEKFVEVHKRFHQCIGTLEICPICGSVINE
jgi:exonuclease SbcC